MPILIVAIIIIDFISKYIAVQTLSATTVALGPFLSLQLSYNCGVAFGALSHCSYSNQIILVAFALILLLSMYFYMKRYMQQKPLNNIGYILIASGAIGNIIDRLIYGHVIDFIHLYYKTWSWPTFNIADCSICIGALFLILFERNTQQKNSA